MGRNEDLDTEMELEEDPPMSHAQKRKLKKRKRGDDDSESGSDHGGHGDLNDRSKRKTSETKDVKERTTATTRNIPGRQHSVWVGNLAFKTTPEDLKSFFKDLEGDITRVKMPKKEGGDKGPNKGFAYVDFATSESKGAAIGFSERPLHGRKLLIKDDSNWQGSHSVATLKDPTTNKPFIMTKTSKTIVAKQQQPPCPVLFIGNLPFGTTIDGLREHFESHSVIKTKKSKEKNLKNTWDEDDESVSSASEAGDGSSERKRRKREDKKSEVLTFEGANLKNGADLETSSQHNEESSNVQRKQEEREDNKALPPTPALSPKEALGLRAIRLGTFEDTGECKGWAFLDFDSTAHATAALLRLPNHYFMNRELKVEYAGADAIRRGGYVEDPGTPGQYTYGFKGVISKPGKKSSKRKDLRPPRAKRAIARQERKETELNVEEEILAGGYPVVTPVAPVSRKHRPKPGSALAMAKRESVAIVPSQGRKLVFN